MMAMEAWTSDSENQSNYCTDTNSNELRKTFIARIELRCTCYAMMWQQTVVSVELWR